MVRSRNRDRAHREAGGIRAATEPAEAADRPAGSPRAPVPTWSIESLTEGGREARIRHADAVYLLRITSNGKLILTK